MKKKLSEPIRSNLNQIRKCYELELKENPKLEGDLFVRWIVNQSGVAKKIRFTKDDIKRESLRSCIASQIEACSFCSPEKPTNHLLDLGFSKLPGDRASVTLHRTIWP